MGSRALKDVTLTTVFCGPQVVPQAPPEMSGTQSWESEVLQQIVHLGDFDIMRNVYVSLSSVLDKELLNPYNFLSARATRNIFSSNI